MVKDVKIIPIYSLLINYCWGISEKLSVDSSGINLVFA